MPVFAFVDGTNQIQPAVAIHIGDRDGLHSGGVDFRHSARRERAVGAAIIDPSLASGRVAAKNQIEPTVVVEIRNLGLTGILGAFDARAARVTVISRAVSPE